MQSVVPGRVGSGRLDPPAQTPDRVPGASQNITGQGDRRRRGHALPAPSRPIASAAGRAVYRGASVQPGREERRHDGPTHNASPLPSFSPPGDAASFAVSSSHQGRRWEVDHRSCVLSPAGRRANLQVLCAPCHGRKTQTEGVLRIAKSKRIQARHLGAWPRPARSRAANGAAGKGRWMALFCAGVSGLCLKKFLFGDFSGVSDMRSWSMRTGIFIVSLRRIAAVLIQ